MAGVHVPPLQSTYTFFESSNSPSSPSPFIDINTTKSIHNVLHSYCHIRYREHCCSSSSSPVLLILSFIRAPLADDVFLGSDVAIGQCLAPHQVGILRQVLESLGEE